jgi:hypothetical protein
MYSFGVRTDDPRKIDADTIFEIGSVSKVFTSLVFADMVHRNEVALDDPAGKYLPDNIRMPSPLTLALTAEPRGWLCADPAASPCSLPDYPSSVTTRNHGERQSIQRSGTSQSQVACFPCISRHNGVTRE